MLEIKASASFKKAAKKLNDRDKGLLKEVLGKLVNNEKLDEKYCDHALKGKYLGFRDCHIRPDLVLIYKIEHNALLLYLANIGSHSELGI
ncbi:MAG: type II toxin-antitoxin system YafQ family toxin [Campylobacter sp.]|uniref:type II toxin-antitoxin system RelE/ParE family toxin n=1 Tax=Campylobacter sp. TaxID=205 RepID=UPI002979CEA0|nr:type II toxin-antitoxin system YafQ family toxin [Campylobacter sp.]MDD7323954.1 type II toxin-antitoxin system YafQ family toxin [Campylobacteraceae bacterium]MDY2818265.1 type II toxin-antitoxin system YafQ family toxin [Campylobacter lanienae]MCI6298271.1 type II toxin-antitoxin system YafQ family toxin [Campylobacter sp.]MCI7587532.1 type II toxin-antitoxin system YafQ family toxin [Campylobacter sp.]MDD7600390.1 type II toxin-antitoxin system YafQ family toxin [Campylobacteraceae bacte